jgi:hypothetical protein
MGSQGASGEEKYKRESLLLLTDSDSAWMCLPTAGLPV